LLSGTIPDNNVMGGPAIQSRNLAQILIKRLGALVLILLGMSLVLFLISHAIPSDPARTALGPEATPVMLENMRRELGLDKPLMMQYGIYMRNLVRGDLGVSLVSHRPVADDLLTFFPATLELIFYSILVSCLIGVPLGISSALRPDSLLDRGVAAMSTFTVSMPVFWVGLLLQFLFYGKLQWLPFGGRGTEGAGSPSGFLTLNALLSGDFPALLNALTHLVLPVTVLSAVTLSYITQMTRNSMLDVLDQDYVRVAHAKGLVRNSVVYKHALRNAAIPIITMIGLRTGDLLAGAVITETIFAWPGIGRYAVTAIENKDFAAIMGFALVVATSYALINMLVDLVYLLLDPRVKA
jgi:peptide/nickel transport system permease protein